MAQTYWRDSVDHVLLTEEQIHQRVQELGKQITEDYRGRNLLLVGILRGAVVFYTDLARTIDLPITFDFLSISSYGASTTSGQVRLLKDIDQSVEGWDILFVEDIVDSGKTLSYLINSFKTRKPASIKICCLLDKKERRVTDVKADYVGFDIPDEFVVGYGLDFASKFRNLPYIGVLKEECYK